MKETINANIGGRAFVMDYDAYNQLKSYLDNVECRLEERSTIDDIEARIAEILAEKVPSPAMVVTMVMVDSAIVNIGPAEQFGPQRTTYASSQHNSSHRQLRRSRKDRSIAGICGGLAQYLQVDSTALRIITLILMIFGGMSLWIYIILWLIIPEED